MRWGKIAFVAVAVVSAVAQADDNVMVDLSVLDDLAGGYAAPSEPLFPVLPKTVKPVTAKIKPSPTKPAAVPEKKPSSVTRPQAQKKTEAPAVVQKAEVVKESEPVVVVDVEPAPSPAVSKTENQPAAAVPVSETLASPDVKALPETKGEINAASPNPEPENSIGAVSSNSEASGVLSAEKADEKSAHQEKGLLNVPSASLPAESVASESVAEKKPVPGLLIDEDMLPSAEKGTIVFAPGSDELTPALMAGIDTIVGRFQNTDRNKIAIYSYNRDDGVDSFKKKRLSLNRAIEVRSYLIKQGYKNFSIKVVNINSDSDKADTVELEEI